ncbi:MAG: mechanosensitive ion channel family protein [Actinomycetota bacterium]
MPILADHVPLDSREWLLSHGLRIVIVLAVAMLLLVLARLAVRRMHRRLEAADSTTQELGLQRAATLTQAVTYVVRIAVWTLTILVLLGEFDLNLGPLIAGAGIVGVALGFGAQSLVRDFLSGFFILLEDQFGVGDVIDVTIAGQQVTGKVEKLNLRTTDVRAFDGTRHTIPNGNIMMVGNRSRGWARVIMDVSVAYTEDIDRVRGVLEELFHELREDQDLQGSFFSGPEVLGVEGVGDKDMVLRVTAEVRPTRKGSLERLLRQRIKERLDLRGIAVPART